MAYDEDGICSSCGSMVPPFAQADHDRIEADGQPTSTYVISPVQEILPAGNSISEDDTPTGVPEGAPAPQ
jgi:hypothetical protein